MFIKQNSDPNLLWLKDMETNFPPHESLRNYDDGVCITYIKDKSGLLCCIDADTIKF